MIDWMLGAGAALNLTWWIYQRETYGFWAGVSASVVIFGMVLRVRDWINRPKSGI